MAKEHWFRKTMYSTVILFTIIGSVAAAISYFAKQKTVDAVIESVKLTNKRLELAIEDDKVNRAQGEVDWVEQRAALPHERRTKTVTEKEMIERAKQKVIDAKTLRAQKQKAYEAAK